MGISLVIHDNNYTKSSNKSQIYKSCHVLKYNT